MTDVHSHILFGIDDGSSSILESLELISKMKKAGFDKIILTPHYIEGTEYSAENKEKLERYELLKKEIDKNNMGVSIYLGNEIFIHNDILKSLDNDLCFSLNNGKYLLVELPFYNQILELDDIINLDNTKNTHIIIRSGKGDKYRTIDISGDYKKLLKEYIDHRPMSLFLDL